MTVEQLSFEVPDIYTALRMDREQKKAKRRWEDHFQKWSNEQSEDGYEPYGCCGYGNLCDYCEDNSYGRPCVRAFNEMCRELKIVPDYTDFDFQKWWYWSGNE